jgi:hypothetical protein
MLRAIACLFIGFFVPERVHLAPTLQLLLSFTLSSSNSLTHITTYEQQDKAQGSRKVCQLTYRTAQSCKSCKRIRNLSHSSIRGTFILHVLVYVPLLFFPPWCTVQLIARINMTSMHRLRRPRYSMMRWTMTE